MPLISVKLCQESYDPTVTWDHVWTRDSVVVMHRKLGQDDHIVFRGSKSIEDWFRDFKGWPIWDKQLGWCHAGFLEDMRDVLTEIIAVVGPNVYFHGHSLGAARACIMAALFVVNGRKVLGVYTFGCPRPGFAKLKRILQEVTQGSWRNLNDPVPEVPVLFKLYLHTCELTQIAAPPPSNDDSVLADHHINLYAAGIEKLYGT
ncbi:MAG: lipase family protein [Pseudomonadota bacterium]|nr:lipase family protein [Pseudomonadota bacterium]